MSRRILIFSLPRCGTTILQQRISSVCNIRNLVEPFNNPEFSFNKKSPNYNPLESPYKWLDSIPSFVVKLLGSINIDIQGSVSSNVTLKELVNLVSLDDIIVVTRENLVDCCLSLRLADTTNVYHYSVKPVNLPKSECPMDYVEKKWLRLYNKFQEDVDWLDKQGVTYTTVSYEQLMSGKSITIGKSIISISNNDPGMGMINAKIDYSTIFTNYDEVDTRIKQWTN